MAVGLILSLAGLIYMLGGRRRRAVILTALSIGFSATYLTWVQLSPPVG